MILVSFVYQVDAELVTLAWNPSLSPNIAGYRLYSGTTSGVYGQTIEVGNATSALVSNLLTGKTYFFVVTAYNTTGTESGASNEVSYLAPSSSATPTPPPSSPSPTATPTSTATATPPAGSAAIILSPPPGSTLASSSVTFTWSAGISPNYVLLLGNSPATGTIYASGTLHVQSTTASNIPTDGRNVYATLYSEINNSWISNSYVYKAQTVSATPTPTPTPAPTSIPKPSATPTPDRHPNADCKPYGSGSHPNSISGSTSDIVRPIENQAELGLVDLEKSCPTGGVVRRNICSTKTMLLSGCKGPPGNLPIKFQSMRV